MIMDRQNPKALDWYYIDAVQTPGIHIESRPVFRAGQMKHYAGPLSIDNLSLTLYTESQGKALKLTSSWFNSVYDNSSGNYRLPIEYKKDVHVYMLDVTSGTVCVFKFMGCMPTTWSSYALDAGSANLLATQIELTVDNFSVEADSGGTNVNSPSDTVIPQVGSQIKLAPFTDSGSSSFNDSGNPDFRDSGG